MSLKNYASDFLTLASRGDVKEAYERYVSQDFIHHNQYFKGDRLTLLTAMEEASITSPNKNFIIKHIYETNDHVITHSLVEKNDMQITVIHIFRFQNNLIAELWDVGQQILENGPNENSPF